MPVGNLQGAFALARPISFVFSYHPFDPSQEQNLLTCSYGWGRKLDFYEYLLKIYMLKWIMSS